MRASKISTQIKSWRDRIDGLSLKERVLVLAAVTLTVITGWDSWLLRPLEHRRTALQESVIGIQQTLDESESLAQSVIAAGQVDPDAPLQGTLARNRAELTTLEGDIKRKVGRMIPPEQMAQVLESVLTRFDRLQFIGLEGLGVEPLTKPTKSEPANAADATTKPASTSTQRGAFRHGLRIHFAGSYLDAIAYLRALEALPFGFFWDEIKLETSDYPRAEGSIVVYTLSLDAGWIGV